MQFLKTPVDLSTKKAAEISKKLKPRKVGNSEAADEDEPHSIYDDMIFTNPLEAPQTVGISKPASIRLIEAIPSAPSAPKAPQKKGPPPIEAFPALGRPAPAAPSGANWSKATASKPAASKQAPNSAKGNAAKGQQQAKPAKPSIDLQDGSSFPTLLGSGDNYVPSRPNGFGPPPPSGARWASNSDASSNIGSSKNRRKNKAAAAVESQEWMRPEGGEEANGSAEDTSPQTTFSALTDPYITHHATGDRNNNLRAKVRQQLQSRAKGSSDSGDASEAFTSFKELSLSYRNGQATADAFFELGRDLLGADFFDAIIADLISLLPSIAKQNELYSRLLADSRLKNSRSAQLWKCTECSQLVIPAEKTEHQRCHTKAGRR